MKNNFEYSDIRFSLFGTIKSKSANDIIDQIVFSWIKNGEWEKQIEHYRNQLLFGDANNIKQQIPAFTPSGRFEDGHAAKNLVHYSKVIHLDFDHVKDVKALKSIIASIPYTYAAFISPSGDGLKVFIKVDTDAKAHKQTYKKVQRFYESATGCKTDDACSNINRLCFVSYDPDLFLNKEAEVFLGKADIKTHEIVNKPIHISEDSFLKKMQDLKTALDKKITFEKGNRNVYIAKLAGKFNRQAIPKDLALSFILDFALGVYSENDITKTVNSIYGNEEFHGVETSNYDFETLINQPNPFPVDVFPKEIQNIIHETNAALQFPIDFIGSSILYAVSVAIGNTYKVEAKTGWKESAALYLAIVGRAGTNKSHPLAFAIEPINKKDISHFDKYGTEEEQFFLLDKKTQVTEKKPVLKQHLVMDYTPEALSDILKHNNRGVGVCSDELAAWFKNFNKYNSGNEEPFWLSSWSSKSIRINRKMSRPILIKSPFISVAGTIQPSVINELAKDKRTENGFMDRILFAFPNELKAEYWSETELDPSVLSKWNQIIDTLFELDFDVNEDFTTKPNILKLDHKAKKVFAKWWNDLVDDSNINPHFSEINAKLRIYFFRLALILELLKNTCEKKDNIVITLESANGAIKLTDYFKYTAIKVKSILYTKKEQNTNIDQKIDLKQVVFNQLPDEFKTKEGLEIAEKCGMRERTFKSFINDVNMFKKVKHGVYEKVK